MHEHYMRRCLELAQRAKGNVAPNPMVGAVLVHDGRIIGEGWHKEFGQSHAEVNCFESVQNSDRHLIAESTMYVSLEPCAHHGKTPPCALRLIDEKVKEVIVSNVDPFAAVAGRGIQLLQQHDIAVKTDVLNAEGLWLNRRFFCFHTEKRPYIILKWAQTQEGLFAPLNRTRYQMSNEHTKQLLHKWRTEEAAIMVGHVTAAADDPQLTARQWSGKQPLRIVLDRKLALPDSLRLFDSEANTWIINEQKEVTEGNRTYVQLAFDEILLTRILERLYTANIQSLIVEGGASLLQSFMNAGLWDEARVFVTETMLSEGLQAPAIRNADKAFITPLDGDELHMYVNETSEYKYVTGMEL
ncbi:MAG: bifunctional diaminohydroxyphosphoribosylaminopyrimidine deaminase/5-amino-6-(5-phosphoribosylamino)uracil reductase RibD [Sphingobacteriales bacterium]|nr:MAG: bifunctional diaminohydroxyphosphoribosylaminopyrimidine deaminase/5-amino-6-(5-phosphoribosylamino)uracil reductase RibD [Sphingobacteriales bacterium]